MSEKVQRRSFLKALRQKVTRTIGFTLLEVLVALTIFLIGIMGVISLQGIALMGTDFSGKMSIARMLSADQLGRLGSMNFTAASLDVCVTAFCHKDLGDGAVGTTVTNLDNLGLADPQGSFRREWDVSLFSADVKQITVRVEWSDVPGEMTNVGPRSFNRSLELGSTVVDPS